MFSSLHRRRSFKLKSKAPKKCFVSIFSADAATPDENKDVPQPLVLAPKNDNSSSHLDVPSSPTRHCTSSTSLESGYDSQKSSQSRLPSCSNSQSSLLDRENGLQPTANKHGKESHPRSLFSLPLKASQTSQTEEDQNTEHHHQDTHNEPAPAVIGHRRFSTPNVFEHQAVLLSRKLSVSHTPSDKVCKLPTGLRRERHSLSYIFLVSYK